jgi:hypothetical protein
MFRTTVKISLTNIGSASTKWLSVKATPILGREDTKESELVSVDDSLLKNLQTLCPNERTAGTVALKILGHLNLYRLYYR